MVMGYGWVMFFLGLMGWGECLLSSTPKTKLFGVFPKPMAVFDIELIIDN